jgi:hypothetical protein
MKSKIKNKIIIGLAALSLLAPVGFKATSVKEFIAAPSPLQNNLGGTEVSVIPAPATSGQIVSGGSMLAMQCPSGAAAVSPAPSAASILLAPLGFYPDAGQLLRLPGSCFELRRGQAVAQAYLTVTSAPNAGVRIIVENRSNSLVISIEPSAQQNEQPGMVPLASAAVLALVLVIAALAPRMLRPAKSPPLHSYVLTLSQLRMLRC